MNIEKILAASEVAGALAGQFSDLPEDKVKCVEAALTLAMAQSYLTELATHLQGGMDPYDALIATAKGILPLSDADKIKLKIFFPSLTVSGKSGAPGVSAPGIP